MPIFSTPEISYKEIAKYNAKKTKLNYSIQIYWSQPITSTYIQFYLSLLFLIIMSILYIWWYLNTNKINLIHTTHLQKTVSSFPFMRLLTAAFLVYYIRINVDAKKTMEIELISIYIEIIMQTLIFVYKTFFWFIVFLISCGWQLYRNWLSTRELRSFIIFYMLIFILICFDQILDILFQEIYIVIKKKLK